MKLLLVSSLFPPIRGGAELQALNLACNCATLGVSVTVLTQPQHGAPREEEINGVRVLRYLDTLSLGPVWGLSYIVSTWLALQRLIDHDTVIHNQQVGLHSWPSIRISCARNNPVVLRLACAGRFGDLARLRAVKYGRLLERSLRQADRYIVLSEEMRNELVTAGFPSDRIRYRPNGVDIQRFFSTKRIPPGTGGGRLRFLFVGRLDPQKGLDTLLNALAALPDNLKWQMDIYGTGPLENELRVLARELGLAELVNLAGCSDDMPSIYRSADLLILPSLHEGMPNVILEAMASGMPVLATDIGGSRELLHDWAPECLVPAGNKSALVNSLKRAIKQRHSLAALGEKARSEVEAHYDNAVLAKEYVEDCEQLLRARKGRMHG